MGEGDDSIVVGGWVHCLLSSKEHSSSRNVYWTGHKKYWALSKENC